MRAKLSQVVRWVWSGAAAVLLALLTVGGYEAPLPIIGIALISFPAGLLAAPMTNLVFDFPMALEGLPFPPPWWIYGLLALVFGYLQWFVVLPIVARRLTAWHRTTRMD
jgi:hypothetical protein